MIIVANPPSVQNMTKRMALFPSRWTCYDPNYAVQYYPYELAYLTSLLKSYKLQAKLIDGDMLSLNEKSFLKIMEYEKPEWIVFESSTPTVEQDLRIARKLKKLYNTKSIFVGQHPSAMPEWTIKNGADYVITGEYEMKALNLFKGNIDLKEKIHIAEPVDINSLPFPEHEMDITEYQTPIEPINEIQMYATRGCNLKCPYCVYANVYCPKSNYRTRDPKNICDEIEHYLTKFNFEGVWFNDEWHNWDTNFIVNLSKEIIKRKLNEKLKFEMMGGISSLNEEQLIAMKNANYYMLRLGVETLESPDPSIQNKKKDMMAKLEKAKEMGFLIYCTFSVGTQGSTYEGDLKTINFIRELFAKKLMFDMQISISVPLPGTPFYDWCEKNNYLISKNWIDYNGQQPVVSYPDYSHEKIHELFREGMIIRNFNLMKR